MAGEAIIAQLIGLAVPALIDVVKSAIASGDTTRYLRVIDILGEESEGLKSKVSLAMREAEFKKSVSNR